MIVLKGAESSFRPKKRDILYHDADFYTIVTLSPFPQIPPWLQIFILLLTLVLFCTILLIKILIIDIFWRLIWN